jgi:predicted TPR repeat methyltransferase
MSRVPAVSDAVRSALRRCATTDVPANVMLTHAFIAARNADEAQLALTDELERANEAGEMRTAQRVRHAIALWHRRPDVFAATRQVAGLVDHSIAPAAPEDAIAYWAQAFDRVAATAPQTGVALYALADPHLLDAATREIVGCMRQWGLVGRHGAVLDLGCGSGRVLHALAPEIALGAGVDISLDMLRAARRLCAAHPNVLFARPSGRDLALFPDRAFDLVYAIDVFPYLVLAGLAERMFAAAARVLGAGGHLLVLNYSYRGDDARDRAEIAWLAHDLGLDVLRDGTRDLALWDGRAYLLRRAA